MLSHSPEETMALGNNLSALCKGGEIICLFGELGSGKTTFVKGIAQGLRIDSTKVNSPTFVIMNVYEGRLPLYHFDLYRIEQMAEVVNLGYEEFLYGQGVAVVEWAERLGELMPQEYLRIELSTVDEQGRQITIKPHGKRYEELVKKIPS